jgi:hypothetical protein
MPSPAPPAQSLKIEMILASGHANASREIHTVRDNEFRIAGEVDALGSLNLEIRG